MAKYALKMLGEERRVEDLKPGDVLLGFHSEPYAVIAEFPQDGKVLCPEQEATHRYLYVRTKVADPLGILPENEGTNVFTKGDTVRVGTVPLKRVPGKMFDWEKPDGSRVELY